MRVSGAFRVSREGEELLTESPSREARPVPVLARGLGLGLVRQGTDAYLLIAIPEVFEGSASILGGAELAFII